VRMLPCRNYGFESRRVDGSVSLVSIVRCQMEVSASDRPHVQRSPTECGVSQCDHEASTMSRPWSTGGFCAMVKGAPHNTPQQAQRRGESLQLLSVRNPALEQSRWSAQRPGRFMSGKDPTGILLEAGWSWTRHISPPTGIRSPDRPARREWPYRPN